ncbi:MAG: aldo/keto reductase [Gammaproteobacteria bacterium]|nr:aldo/keto reductase [Gammaproteobacteria bacterium]
MEVSLLGLGTVKFGRNQGVNYGSAFTIPDAASARGLLDVARDLGINLLDTAPAYGKSEERLGILLKNSRADWLLSTKIGEEFQDGISTHDFTPEQTEISVRRSLTRLQTDYLDIVLIHSDGNDLEILDRLGTLQALQALKRAGLIRAVGISHKTVPGAERALAMGADVLMATLNVETTSEAQIIETAGAAGCGVLVKKALAGGRAPLDGLRYAARQPGVSSLVVGTINPIHLRENARILDSLS